MTFAMLCFRRTTYIELAIDSINSLHYHNPRHKVLLHVDEVCMAAYWRFKGRLDYPNMVETLLIKDDPDQPWPYTKLEIVLAMAEKGIPFVDADSRWHVDPAPLLAGSDPMFLVVVNAFSDNETERKLLELWLGKPQWTRYLHYNTGFVYFPPGSYRSEFGTLARRLARRIREAEALPGEGGALFAATGRVCEEIALGLAAQEICGDMKLRTLKVTDGPGDRNIMQSFYYGCVNGIV